MTPKKGKYIFRFPIKCIFQKKINHVKPKTYQLTPSNTTTTTISTSTFSSPLYDGERRRPPLLTPPHNCMSWKTSATSSPSCKRRVMVVADATAESVAAVQYVISHAMQDNDDLILMHVTQPSKKSPLLIKSFFRRHSDPGLAGISNFDPSADAGVGGGGSGGGSGGGGGKDFLEVMRRACKGTFPNSRVWVEKVEQGSLDSKGDVILLRCKELMVDLLVVGQRRHLVSVLLGPRRSFSTGSTVLRAAKSIDMVEYLIENCPCTCVAVQKKGQNSGYILNSKTHRNFWLLV